MTILTPLMMVGLVAGTIWFSMQEGDEKKILVIEEKGLLSAYFANTKKISFDFRDELAGDEKDEYLKSYYGIIEIPQFDLYDPKGFQFSSNQNPSFDLVQKLEREIESGIKDLRLQESGLIREFLDSLEANIQLRTLNVSDGAEKESHAAVSFGIGYVAAFLIYLFIFIYGAQVMRGIIEEKTSKVVEVIISSVKPFQLMMGKVLGIASVGFTQLFIWICLGSLFVSIGGTLLLDGFEPQAVQNPNQPMPDFENIRWVNALIDFPIFTFLFSFIFYFLGGYLFYSALFAAIGSAVDVETDSQQFMLPITIPLILAIISLAPVLNNPQGPLAFWLSLIPFTSPVIMIARIPFGVPYWEIVLSMVCLVLGFIFTIWMASRIYRIGILIHGSKVNYRILARWLFKSY